MSDQMAQYERRIESITVWIESNAISDRSFATELNVGIDYFNRIFRKRTRVSFLALEKAEALVIKYSNGKEAVSPTEWGNYTRQSVKHIEGRYQLIRPAFLYEDEITATDFTISWDHAVPSLYFRQKDMAEWSFRWRVSGRIALYSDTGIYNFVADDNRFGRHQLMCLRFDDKFQMFFGISIGITMEKLPKAFPVVLMPWDTSEKAHGRVTAQHKGYAKYRTILDEVATYGTGMPTLVARYR